MTCDHRFIMDGGNISCIDCDEFIFVLFEEQKEEIKRLRDALTWYANRSNWVETNCKGCHYQIDYSDTDSSGEFATYHGGKKAREALDAKS